MRIRNGHFSVCADLRETAFPATASYAMLDYMLKAESHPDCHVGTVEGYPAFADALRLMKKQPARTVMVEWTGSANTRTEVP